MLFVVNRFLLKKGFAGFACWPFIVVRDKKLKTNALFVNHERIHLRQQIELLVLPFFIWYGLEFLMRWLHYRNGYLAYRNISFEREAYTHENDFSYLKHRTFWGFMQWI